MLTKRDNFSVKALSEACFDRVKRFEKRYGKDSEPYARALFEYELAVRSSDSKENAMGEIKYHNMPFSKICDLFSRKHGGHCGATKRTHTEHPDGWALSFFVVKRYKWHGHEFWGEGCGNQLIDEINCWLRFQNLPESDYLCPIFKYETAKSDKCRPLSDTMKERVCIIAQKAVHVDDLEGACKDAYYRNLNAGLKAQRPMDRMNQMQDFAETMGWRDVIRNPGNSGVIYDYAQGCYKAVFIDYAL